MFLEPEKVGRAGGAPGMNVPRGFPWPVTWRCLSWRVVGRVLEPWALWTLAWLRASLPHLGRLESWCLPVECSSHQTSCMASWECCPLSSHGFVPDPHLHPQPHAMPITQEDLDLPRHLTEHMAHIFSLA